MNKIILCNHTGSFNRGCDAIIKSTADIFSEKQINTVLAEHRRKEDRAFGESEFDEIIDYSEFDTAPLLRSASLVLGKIFRKEYISAALRQKKIWNELTNAVGLNVGGDTYCYNRMDRLPSMMLNEYCFRNGYPLIFWGCSIEDNIISDSETLIDLKKYSYICPRESITRDNLLKAGIPDDKILYMADPAFKLKMQNVMLPKGVEEKNTVGINLSPLVLEKSNAPDILLNSYCKLIRWILLNTDMSIALIPHVYREFDTSFGDLKTLDQIKGHFLKEERVILIDDFYNSKQLKYIVSQCRFVVTARTHVSIAAYSSYVPTLVLGYSVKARGIATDLFGNDHNYVKKVQEIENEEELVQAFQWLCNHEDEIIRQLKKSVPECHSKIDNTVNIIVERFMK